MSPISWNQQKQKLVHCFHRDINKQNAVFANHALHQYQTIHATFARNIKPVTTTTQLLPVFIGGNGTTVVCSLLASPIGVSGWAPGIWGSCGMEVGEVVSRKDTTGTFPMYSLCSSTPGDVDLEVTESSQYYKNDLNNVVFFGLAPANQIVTDRWMDGCMDGLMDRQWQKWSLCVALLMSQKLAAKNVHRKDLTQPYDKSPYTHRKI